MVVASPEMGAGVGHLVDNEVEVAPTKMGAGDVGSDSANQHEQGIGSQVQAWSSKAGAALTASDNLTGMGVSMAALGP
ncbi:hypothetical protein V6N13_149096 [Hibiscus sabdariffa]